MKKKIGVVIQARTSSTRLPNKILKKLPYNSDKNVLQQVISRVKCCKKVDKIIIATTTDKSDDILEQEAIKAEIECFRGDLNDVLSRYYYAAKNFHLDIIVRITSDCPCIDPEIIDAVIEKLLDEKADYTSNVLKRTFAHGLDTEVFTFNSLEEAYNKATLKSDREHVCTYFYRTHPEKFKIASLEAKNNLFAPDIRITLDTSDDYILLSAIYDYLYEESHIFLTQDIIKLFEIHPWLKLINIKILQKKTYQNIFEEKMEAIKLLKLQELNRIAEILEEKVQIDE